MNNFRRWILHLSIPIQRLMQKLTKPEPLVTGEFFRSVDHQVMPGDVLLSRETWHFTNYFIPGFWGHAAMATVTGVVEAVGSGVRSVERAEWILKKDYVLILRPNLAPSKLLQASELAKSCIGEPYDYEFGMSKVKAWYCSELVWSCLNLPEFTLRETFGVLTVTPQDFENAVTSGKFRVIADSRLIPLIS